MGAWSLTHLTRSLRCVSALSLRSALWSLRNSAARLRVAASQRMSRPPLPLLDAQAIHHFLKLNLRRLSRHVSRPTHTSEQEKR
jgi:hypothetical protein